MATSPLPLTRVLGTIGKFDSTVEHISTYLERLQLYFDANKVKDDCKVPVLLTVIGLTTCCEAFSHRQLPLTRC